MPGGKSRRGQTVVSLGAERTAIAGQCAAARAELNTKKLS
jgi:hypothetical protein